MNLLDLTLTNSIILGVAALLAGILNALAGGGSFLTLPALVYIGVPPVIANATSTVAVFPGYFSSSLGFREEIAAYDRSNLMHLIMLSCIGGIMGSLLLLVTPSETFRSIVPWLLLFATLLFAFSQSLMSHFSAAGNRQTRSGKWGRHSFSILLVSIYGGYFNGGLGIILLATFSMMGLQNLNQMNGLKNLLSLILSSVSVLIFAIAGIVFWPAAIIMMISATMGGFIGARLARKLPAALVRGLIVIIGLMMSMAFFMTRNP